MSLIRSRLKRLEDVMGNDKTFDLLGVHVTRKQVRGMMKEVGKTAGIFEVHAEYSDSANKNQAQANSRKRR